MPQEQDSRKPPRRPEFDEICNGWGGDGADDLEARLQLLVEFWQKNFPLTDAEHKVARAMTKRLGELGGVDVPTFQ